LEGLLRVPGIGARNAHKIIQARRFTTLSFEDLIKMKIALKRAKHFITCNGKFYGAKNETAVKGLLISAENGESAIQTDIFSLLQNEKTVSDKKLLFSDSATALTVRTGEL